MQKTLVILAHPDIRHSRLNSAIMQELLRIENTEYRDLYKLYPDAKVDKDAEQALVLEHDRLVFQFPMYWYSAPSLLKEWIDTVFSMGFAFGEGGDKLGGKEFMIISTSGGEKEFYRAGSMNHYSYSELFKPYQAMANLTGMKYLPAFVIGGASKIGDEELEAEIEALKISLQGEEYIGLAPSADLVH